MIKTQVKVGRNTIEATFDKMSEVHKFHAQYGSLPEKCDACGNDNLYLSYKNPKGNDYYMVECGKCGATANFGIHKDGKGLFWKKEKMTVYQGNGQQSQDSAPQQDNYQDPFKGEEVPF